jgi:hypothetical protein
MNLSISESVPGGPSDLVGENGGESSTSASTTLVLGREDGERGVEGVIGEDGNEVDAEEVDEPEDEDEDESGGASDSVGELGSSSGPSERGLRVSGLAETGVRGGETR